MKFNEQLQDIEQKSIGISRNNVSLSQQVYSDLVLAKKWKDVQYKAIKELDICVFLAFEPSNQKDQLIILPILQDEAKLSTQRITQLFDILSNAHITDLPIDKLTLAIYASDSTIVYYHISKGLVKSTQRN